MSAETEPILHRVQWRPVRAIRSVAALLIVVAAVAVAVDRTIFSDTTQATRPELQRTLDGLVAGRDRVAPGATAYVSGPHGTWTGASGLANVKTGEAIRPDARMRMESVSKAWTATLILQLVGEGRMRLDDRVARWLPGLLRYGNRISVRELLNHTSGLIDNNDIAAKPAQYIRQVRDPALRAELLDLERRWTVDPALRFPPSLWVRFAAALPLLSTPGTRYHYSNIGYEIAGMIAEKVSGARLASLYEQRIIRPLGLTRTAYDPQGEITGPHPRGYSIDANGTLIDATAWHGGIGAEGGIVADARDEAWFLKALMGGRLLRPSQLVDLKVPPAIGSNYALGFAVVQSGCAGVAYQHSGGGAAFKTSVFVSGDGTRVAVLLLNGDTVDNRADVAAYSAARRLYCAA